MMSITELVTLTTAFNSLQLAVVVAIVVEMRTLRRDVTADRVSLDSITKTVNRTGLQVAAIQGRLGIKEEA